MIFTFDPPETGWSLNALCSIVPDAAAPSPPNVLRLGYSGTLTANCIRTLSGLTVGQSYDVWAWVNFDLDAQGGATLRFTYNDNPAQLYVDIHKALDEFDQPLDLGWELRFIGTLHYTFADRVFRIQGPPTTAGVAAVLVDSIYIGEAPPGPPEIEFMLSKWDAISNASSILRTKVNGGDFKTNLEGRVYGRMIFPTDPEQVVARPYVCIPLDQEAERIVYEGVGFTSTWRLIGYAFFDDNVDSDKMDSKGAMFAALFRDDIIRVFMEDQYLNGQVQNVEVVSVDTASGTGGDPTTWVVFTIEFTQIGAASDLSL